jgi:hypothetical protein
MFVACGCRSAADKPGFRLGDQITQLVVEHARNLIPQIDAPALPSAVQ